MVLMAEKEILNFHQALHFAIESILFCVVFSSRDVRQGRLWMFLLQLTEELEQNPTMKYQISRILR